MKKIFSILAILGLALVVGFAGKTYAAAPSVTAATGGSAISLDTCNGA
jgi:ABC-type transport system substrate-binding protein